MIVVCGWLSYVGCQMFTVHCKDCRVLVIGLLFIRLLVIRLLVIRLVVIRLVVIRLLVIDCLCRLSLSFSIVGAQLCSSPVFFLSFWRNIEYITPCS